MSRVARSWSQAPEPDRGLCSKFKNSSVPVLRVQSTWKLCRNTCTDANTLSAMLKLIEERGLIRRMNHPEDCRARAVYLTQEGRDLVERLHADVGPFRKRLLQVLGKENLDIFIRCLHRLSKAAMDFEDSPANDSR